MMMINGSGSSIEWSEASCQEKKMQHKCVLTVKVIYRLWTCFDSFEVGSRSVFGLFSQFFLFSIYILSSQHVGGMIAQNFIIISTYVHLNKTSISRILKWETSYTSKNQRLYPIGSSEMDADASTHKRNIITP